MVTKNLIKESKRKCIDEIIKRNEIINNLIQSLNLIKII